MIVLKVDIYLFHVFKFCSLQYFECITLFIFILSVNVNCIYFFTALFEFFTRTPTPSCFGTLYTLPAGLKFLFESTRPEIMVIRTCYARILSIVCEQFSIDSKTPGKLAGVLFTGAQGNSKVNTYWILILILIIRSSHWLHYVLYDKLNNIPLLTWLWCFWIDVVQPLHCLAFYLPG